MKCDTCAYNDTRCLKGHFDDIGTDDMLIGDDMINSFIDDPWGDCVDYEETKIGEGGKDE